MNTDREQRLLVTDEEATLAAGITGEAASPQPKRWVMLDNFCESHSPANDLHGCPVCMILAHDNLKELHRRTVADMVESKERVAFLLRQIGRAAESIEQMIEAHGAGAWQEPWASAKDLLTQLRYDVDGSPSLDYEARDAWIHETAQQHGWTPIRDEDAGLEFMDPEDR